jgi:DNA polymerase-4
MHIDFNSCFATIEQQANPLLRNKPIGVVAYDSPNGCILAPSIEAKRYGVKTGMRASEGKQLCPQLITLTGDVAKYRYAHDQLAGLISHYSNDFWPKSIDEFIVNFAGYPAYQMGYEKLGLEIKARINETIGDWMRVSIGFGPNRFLAKLGASIRKPDGLVEINKDNYMDLYSTMKLQDLNGIAHRNEIRLKSVGIYLFL